MSLDSDGWPVVEEQKAWDENVPAVHVEEIDLDEWAEESPKPKKKDGRSSKKARDGRRATSGSFKKGEDGGDFYRNPDLQKPVPGEGFLRDLRNCLINPKCRDRTPGEKLARRMFDGNPAQFRKELKELEAEERSAKDNTINSGPDLGHDAACRVLDRLLAEATS